MSDSCQKHVLHSLAIFRHDICHNKVWQLNRWHCHPVTESVTHLLILEHTEWPKRLVTFDTFDYCDEGTWPDQQKDNHEDNDKDKYIYINLYLSPFYFFEQSNFLRANLFWALFRELFWVLFFDWSSLKVLLWANLLLRVLFKVHFGEICYKVTFFSTF